MTMTEINYYNPVKNWRKIKRHLAKAEPILVRDFNKFTIGRWRQPFRKGQVPRMFESCDWDIGHKGRSPEYWNYVKHSACHWLVNHNLILAQSVEPNRPWRILTSEGHSTVFDGETTLFDLNFRALGVPAEESYRIATQGRRARELPPGKFLRVYRAQHCSVDH
jgi:hypothetical protein